MEGRAGVNVWRTADMCGRGCRLKTATWALSSAPPPPPPPSPRWETGAFTSPRPPPLRRPCWMLLTFRPAARNTFRSITDRLLPRPNQIRELNIWGFHKYLNINAIALFFAGLPCLGSSLTSARVVMCVHGAVDVPRRWLISMLYSGFVSIVLSLKQNGHFTTVIQVKL